MKFDVELAPPFRYATWYLILVVIALVGCLVLTVWLFWKRRKKPTNVKPEKPTTLDIAIIKKKYLMRVDELSRRVDYDRPREGYRELSALMRSFVFEVTGIKVTKLTLREIDRRSFPALYKIIEEIYSPEFSKEGKGDLASAIAKVKGEISTWK